jgi:hypothetical protein
MKRRHVQKTFDQIHAKLDEIEGRCPVDENGTADGGDIAGAIVAFGIGVGMAEFDEKRLREIVEESIDGARIGLR